MDNYILVSNLYTIGIGVGVGFFVGVGSGLFVGVGCSVDSDITVSSVIVSLPSFIAQLQRLRPKAITKPRHNILFIHIPLILH